MPSSQALLKAISAGRPRQVRLLLDSGASVTETDECGQTTLIRTIFLENDRSRRKLLRMLLKHGALVSTVDVVGRNALAWSCIYGRDDDTALLIEKADVDIDFNAADINGQTALFHAVSSGNAACVKLIVLALQRYGLSVDVADYNGFSPLMHAIRLGFDVCASILIRNGKAKVGLGMKYPKDFVRVEKWATQSLRDRERVSKKANFLPLLTSSKHSNHNSRNTSAKSRMKNFNFSASSDDESASDSGSVFHSDISSESSFGIGRMRENYLDCMTVSNLQLPSSTSSKPVSTTSSTLAHPGSDEDVDSFSTPYVKEDNQFLPSRDLPKMYGIVQDQMSSSYRKESKVKTPRTPALDSQPTFVSERSDVTIASVRSARKGTFSILNFSASLLKHWTGWRDIFFLLFIKQRQKDYTRYISSLYRQKYATYNRERGNKATLLHAIILLQFCKYHQ
ncbi:hypothetical protein FSP39_023213 [Pinctada imbricata]|uniref:Uncharacterized protein n=1 Tax=Pinctada imbricata TaxID=66713 RepID=A0AA88XUA8_PINIB|nr:hypothetical protein FSP39_023213 [Pinctada imbricata]